ncbi:MAG TPA: acyl-CoA thioesterase [Bacteroidales bacterium]|nr:acyl-CoA thioesterase [Bacteroidales bacterium]
MTDNQHIFRFRVAYSDTDQMGVMHHSNYLKYFEMARHEFLKGLSISYAEIEEGGVIMPVIQANVDYKKPVFYDQVISIETCIILNKGPRIVFGASMINESKEVVCTSKISLAYVKQTSRKACFPPAIIKSKLINIKN